MKGYKALDQITYKMSLNSGIRIKTRCKSWVVMGLIVAGALLSRSTFAAIILVPDQYATIQSAIDSAETGDEVVVRDGEYEGEGFRDIRFNGKAITVRSENGRDYCIIRGPVSNEHHTAFSFDQDETSASLLMGFTIVDFKRGPAISVAGASPVIAWCTFIGNVATMSGGALYATGSRIDLVGNIFRSNHGGFDGGAIGMWDTTGTIADCVFDSNRNDDCGIDAYGGAIAAWRSAVDFVNCLFVNNVARATEYQGYSAMGGAMFLDGYDQTEPHRLINCTLYGNRIEGVGQYSGIFSNGPIELRSCIIWNNDSNFYGPTPDIQYCILPQSFTGEGNLNVDPEFHAPEQGDFYLDSSSPCINSGHANSADVCFDSPVGEICLNDLWSKLSLVPDSGIVDRGYHYPEPWSGEPPATATPSPEPTDNPTATPQATPTPDPCVETGVRLHMPAHFFMPNEPCGCSVTVCNQDPSALVGYPLFVILDVHGSYFFGPSFAEELDSYLLLYDQFPPGTTVVEALPMFAWPDAAGVLDGLYFHAALTDPAITRLHGTADSWEFGSGL